MSTNVISQSARQEIRDRSMVTRVVIKVMGFLINVLMFVGGLIESRRLKLRYREFTPRPDDIFVVTYPRSGTTLVMMILYQILTDGNMDFAHIHEWIPFYEDQIIQRQNVEDLPSPRVFKTHLDYKAIPKGQCKYIYVLRNGKDVAVSFFHYRKTHMNFKADFGKFFESFLQGKSGLGSWFEHVSQWWENRQNLNVMFLTYEELASNREQAVRKIINFCGRAVGPDQLARIMERSSFAFMKQHEDKFDTLTWKLMESNLKTGSFIRKAQVGQWKEYLNNEQEELYQRTFTEHLHDLSPELKEVIR